MVQVPPWAFGITCAAAMAHHGSGGSEIASNAFSELHRLHRSGNPARAHFFAEEVP